MNSNRGYLYIATGIHFLREAQKSCKSLKNAGAKYPVVLFTDVPESADPYLFDHIYNIDKPKFNFIDKIQPLASSPFEETIFLDTDTYVCEDISPLFQLLEKYDFIGSFAPGRQQKTFKVNVPLYFPEFNTGLIGFRKNVVTKHVIERWLNLYILQLKTSNPPHDQPAFRQALFESEALVYNLPSEYNFRTEHPNVVWGNSTVKMIHGRHSKYDQLSIMLNQNEEQIRLFYHDARFLQSDSLRFFKLNQNRSFYFKIVLAIYGYAHRMIYRLLGDGKPLKKKG
ncbi:MAG: putative nucleotide-diphospho-sugar transferase [Cyclobacteriaceae bacterium]